MRHERPDPDASGLQWLFDERCVIDRLHEVCHTIDGHDAEAWVSCFTDDGVFEFVPAGGREPVLDLRGHDALRTWFASHRERFPLGSQRHIVFNPRVTMASDRALARSHYMTLRGRPGEVSVASSGEYVDELRRDGDEWHIVRRQAFGVMPHPVDSFAAELDAS